MSDTEGSAHDGSSLYSSAFYLSCVLTTAIVLYGRKVTAASTTEMPSEAFKRFQMLYLGVYYLMVAGDWLQGPYVYALYDSYGFSKSDIAVLFVAGFGSSMVFGTFIGSLADKMGRKNFCVLYAVFYIASCLTKHFNDYWILMLGRLLGGISTSLLFSTFETWLVCEHNKRNFPGDWLSKTFSLQFFGNSIVAIVSGVVAQWGADAQALTPTSSSFNYGGYTAPFDMAIFVLLAGGLIAFTSWDENYGENENAEGPCSAAAMQRAIDLMKRTPPIVLCGAIQSFFEGAMYTFVFMWTPALTPEGSSPPYGQIFATFMVCCMAGSSMYPLIAKSMEPVQILQKVMAVSAAALAMPVLTSSPTVIFGGFLAFEFAVGLYFPAVSTLKSTVVPEASRAAIYNLFRVPLNVIVLGVLLSDISTTTAFACCTALLVAALYFTLQIAKHDLEAGASETPDDVEKGVQMQERNLDDLLGGEEPST